jgi:ribosomal 30S subunit maturation factor RimM
LVLRNQAGDEVLIPFVRAYLRKIDIEGKFLEMELPAGLLATQTDANPDADEDEPE